MPVLQRRLQKLGAERYSKVLRDADVALNEVPPVLISIDLQSGRAHKRFR